MIWILVIPACLVLSVLLTWLADWAFWGSEIQEDPLEKPCEHPWFMDGRCIVCGHPR